MHGRTNKSPTHALILAPVSTHRIGDDHRRTTGILQRVWIVSAHLARFPQRLHEVGCFLLVKLTASGENQSVYVRDSR